MSELQDERARRLAKVEAERAGRAAIPTRYASTGPTRRPSCTRRDEGIDAGAEVDDTVRVAGRLMLIRRQGKLTFATLRDGTGTVQLFVSRAVIGDERHAAFDDLDLGDWVGAEGTVMKTKKGELSVKVTAFELLAKALRPLPDKWHGLADVDTRFRQRYVDLIVNEEARRVFEVRFTAIDAPSARSSRSEGSSRWRRRCSTRSRWRDGQALLHAPQRARPRSHASDRARAAPQASARRRIREGLRDRPGVPQRGAGRRGTTPSSRCSRPTRRSPTTTT